MFSSEAFSFISFKRVKVSNSFSPLALLIVLSEVFRKLINLIKHSNEHSYNGKHEY